MCDAEWRSFQWLLGPSQSRPLCSVSPPLADPDGRRLQSTQKHAIKIPGGKSPLAPAQLGTHVSRMAGSFLPNPGGMTGLQRPFIKMNYEPVGLSGSIWPRLGGGVGAEAPLAPCLHSMKPSSSPPWLGSFPSRCAPPIFV